MKKSARGQVAPRKAHPQKSSLGTQQVRLAAAMGGIVKSKAKSTHLESGRMYLGPVATAAALPANGVYMEVSLFPSDIEPSRLAQLAGMYSRFKWKRAKIIYEPAVGSSSNGGFFMWIDNDPTAPVPNVNALGEVSIAHKASASFPVWSEAGISWSPTLQDKWLYCVASEDPREYSAGIFRLATDSTNLTANTLYGRVYLDYEVEFREESLTSAAVTFAVEGTSTMSTANLVTGAQRNILTELTKLRAGTGIPEMTSGALLDAMPTAMSDGLNAVGVLLPPGAYLAEAEMVERFVGSVTNLTGVSAAAVKVYDPSTGSDESSEIESSTEVLNVQSPATKGVYKSTIRSVFELIKPMIVDIAVTWAGDTQNNVQSDTAWSITNIAPLIAKTAVAFLATQPNVMKSVGPSKKLQLCAVDLSFNKQSPVKRGVRRYAPTRLPPSSLPASCVSGCATFARVDGKLVCPSCGRSPSASGVLTAL